MREGGRVWEGVVRALQYDAVIEGWVMCMGNYTNSCCAIDPWYALLGSS